MARILFGIMGDALGHLYQALAVASQMKTHEFLFIGGGRTSDLRARGLAVEEVPVPATLYSNNRVDCKATLRQCTGVLLNGNKTADRVIGIVKEFNPDLVLTAREYFVPIVARKMGLKCFSIDNQHFLDKCVHMKVRGQIVSRLLFSMTLRTIFDKSDTYLVNSFFPCSPIDPSKTEVFPPLLNPAVMEVQAAGGDHVLVYQTSPTFDRLVGVLEEMPHPCIVYGLGDRPNRPNIVFKRPSPSGFLQDLAACRYVITNGGHNAISEALYLGKPVFSFPIGLAYEQYYNACMLKKLGYGDYSLERAPTRQKLMDFESRLDAFRERISQGDFFGNRKLAARLEEFL